MLPVAVVDGQLGGVAVLVVGAVVGELRHRAAAEAWGETFLPCCLVEVVEVPLPFAAVPHVVHNGAGDAALRVVEIAFHIPIALGDDAVQIHFGALGVDVAVLAHGGGVPCRRAVDVHTAVPELVLPAGVEESGAQRQAEVVVQFLFVEAGEAYHVARPVFHACLQVVGLAVGEPGAVGADIYRPGVAEVAGCLEDSALLTVVERHLVDVVERELPQVYLSVLGIAQFHAVVVDAEVVGAHAADVDGLDAAHAAVVFQLKAGEIAQGICHGVGVEFLELLTAHFLRGDDLAEGEFRGHHHLVEMPDAVAPGIALGIGKGHCHTQQECHADSLHSSIGCCTAIHRGSETLRNGRSSGLSSCANAFPAVGPVA